MQNIKAVIFDLDGTLIDTLRDIAQSVNQALEKLGFSPHPVDAYRLKVGNGARIMVLRSLPDDHQHLVDAVLKHQREYYTDHCYDHTQPYPGITEMLGELKKASLKLAVLSNKSDHFTHRLVNHFFPAGLFDIIRGQLPDVPLKPDPAPARAIAERFGLDPEKIVFVGDTAVDMQTARRAGMFAIGVSWGFRDRDELEQNGCNTIIEHPMQLPLLFTSGA
jgi:phosphoglycolate phosphatase